MKNTNLPTYTVYQVIDREKNNKAIWTKIGAAWPHQDGSGFNLQLNAVPLTGSIVLRKIEEEGNIVEGFPGLYSYILG